jgi:hypothetical protein
MIPILTGFAAGGLHVFAGPDHLAALAPLAIEDRANAGRTGATWGFGHGIGVVVVGALGLMLRGLVDLESWSSWAEFLVGFLLVGVGVWAIRRASRLETHAHEHEHGGAVHDHVHTHDVENGGHTHAAFGVGVLHGVAGSGHLFGVLPALALPTAEAVLYLISYLIAAVAAMGTFAWALGAVTSRGGPTWVQRVMYASGAIALVAGLVWIVNSWLF